MKCSRTACQVPLNTGDTVYLIHNDTSTDVPRPYCYLCGRTIITWNQRNDEITLQYTVEIVK